LKPGLELLAVKGTGGNKTPIKTLQRQAFINKMKERPLHLYFRRPGEPWSPRAEQRLKDWMQPPQEEAYWPMLVAFRLTLEKIHITTDKVSTDTVSGKSARDIYSKGLQLFVSFCGEEVPCPVMPWKKGISTFPRGSSGSFFSRTINMDVQNIGHAHFILDGPSRLPTVDIFKALEQEPEPSCRLRFTLKGLKGTGQIDRLGDVELCAGNLFRQGDVGDHDFDPTSEPLTLSIECATPPDPPLPPPPSTAAPAGGPPAAGAAGPGETATAGVGGQAAADTQRTSAVTFLRAEVVVSTRRAARLREVWDAERQLRDVIHRHKATETASSRPVAIST
jgi:hypothetical protein